MTAIPKQGKKKPKPKIKMTKIRSSARGSHCYLQLSNVCNYSHETTVWAHVGGIDAGAGRGLKGLDVCGMPLCSECHAFIDQARWNERNNEHTRDSVHAEMFTALVRSIKQQHDSGLIKISESANDD